MKNIDIKNVAALYEGQTIGEQRAKLEKTIESATFCLLIIYDETGAAINCANDYDAVRSYAYNLRTAKVTKNGTR